MTTRLFGGMLALLLSSVGVAQEPAVEITVTVSDGAGGSQELKVGLDPAATDSLDPLLGEFELPPPPPTGVFDARLMGSNIGLDLGQGTTRDFRAGDTTLIGVRIHELQYQVGSGSEITIAVDLPPGASCRFQDFVTGTVIDTTLETTGVYTVQNPGALPRLKATVTYVLSVPAVPVLVSPVDGSLGEVPGSPLVWASASSASAYRLQVAADSLFAGTVLDTTTADTLLAMSTALLAPGTDYWWRVAAVNAKGEGPFTMPWGFTTALWNSADQTRSLPERFVLHRNYPNPFNPSTTIRYGVPVAADVTLTVWNSLGERVAVLAEGMHQPGTYEVRWEAEGTPSGVYFCMLRSGGFLAGGRMILLR